MADLVDCNFEDDLVFRLEKISQDFLSIPVSEFSQEEIDLLNENTRLLNEELRNFRNLRFDLAKSNSITPTLKIKIRDRFVPTSLFETYDRATITTVQNFIDFTKVNSDFFRETFPNEERIFDGISGIDPTAFRTFSSEFPSIEIRLRSGPISSAEVNSLIQENRFDPNKFGSDLKTNKRGIFGLLERLLSSLGIGIGIMGSFCALVEDVFALSRGQRDLTGNSAAFLGNFQNVLGLINPSAAAVVGQVQELISLATSAQEGSVGIASNLQGAFGTLSSAFGIVMIFVDILAKVKGETVATGGIEVEWNFQGIRDAIGAADPLFLVVLDETNKPLGDINQDGVMDGNDAIALQTYIDDAATQAINDYVNNILVPFLNANAQTYSQFVDFPSAQEPGSNVGDLLGEFSSVAGKFGAAPGSGDFGLANIIQIITLASGIISSIQALVSGSRPVNIQGLFQQLDQVLDLGAAAKKGIEVDFQDLSNDYQETVESALKEAEENSVDNPEKTAEISQKNQESLKDNYTKALETSAEASKNLGPRLTDAVNKIRNGIRQLAAVGVLESLDQQLESVIDQSAAQLNARVNSFSPASLDNGFHFNMGSSYSKMSGQVSSAKIAASDDTTEVMKTSVRGMIAQASEKYRQKNKEEVEFVALRFCKLAGEIERLYKEVTKPLEQMTNEFRSVDADLSAAGNGTTLGAVRAGAIRYDTQTRLRAIQQSGGISPTIATPYINNAGVRTITPGDGISVGSLPPLPADYQFPAFEEALRGTREVRYGALTRGSARQRTGVAGFTVKPYGGVDEESMRKLLALARAWGRQILISSAYRSPAANAAVGGARQSLHMSGKAFDCSGISNRSEQIRFMNLAYQAGFTGFGAYNSFVHIDTRGANVSFGNFRYYNLPGPNGGKTG